MTAPPPAHGFDCSVAEDPERIDAMVDSMANMLAYGLVINNDFGKHKARLGHVLHTERQFWPCLDTLDTLEEIFGQYCWLADVDALAADLLAECRANKGGDVLLTRHSLRTGWIECRSFHKGLTERTHKLGGIGDEILEKVELAIFHWLVECDRLMCHASSDFGDEGETEPPPGSREHMPLYETVSAALQKLALDVAERVVCMEQGYAPEAPSPAAAAKEGEEGVAIRALEVLARCGATGEEAQRVLATQMHLVSFIVHGSPADFVMWGRNSENMGLELLAPACVPTVDAGVRAALVARWQRLHGPQAAAACQQALFVIGQAANAEALPWVDVLLAADVPEEEHHIKMPHMKWRGEQYAYFFTNVPIENERLCCRDWPERRIVRLCSLVEQLLSLGELERGRVGAQMVRDVVFMQSGTARICCCHLRFRRDSIGRGMRLLAFFQNLVDSESQLGEQMRQLMCNLSKFSAAEVLAAFHHQSHLLPCVLPELSIRTRAILNELGASMPEQYEDFAYDALPPFLCHFWQRRARAGVPPHRALNPMAELLRTSVRVRSWGPLQGSLQLTVADLKDAAPDLVRVLKAVAASSNGLVVYKRPYMRGSAGRQKHPKLHFCFETPMLVKLLRQQQ